MHLHGFTIERAVAAGGMGRVFAGVHVDSGQPVAIKVTRGASDEERAAFAREVEAVAGLDHPRIVLVYDHGVVPEDVAGASQGQLEAGAPYLVMELATGGTVSADGIHGWSGLRRILLEVLDALAHAHARGVIHRDLKPGNLLVCTPHDLRPGLKLSDFGLAHGRGAPGEARLARGGTLPYMAPEQIRGAWKDFGPWTDLYALGCLAWELATGTPPFTGGIDAVVAGHLGGALPAFAPVFPTPPGLEDWLHALLRKDPEARPRRAALVAQALVALGDAAAGPAAPRQAGDEADTFGWTSLAVDAYQALPAPPLEERDPGRDAALPARWTHHEPVRPLHVLHGAGLGLYVLRARPVVRRQAERDALWQAMHDVAEQGRAHAVVLRGPAGIGTSRLGQWLADRVGELGAAEVFRLRHGPDARDGWGTWFAAHQQPAEPPYRYLMNRAREGRCVVHVDEAQWGGAAVQVATRALRERDVSPRPVLFVLSVTSDEPLDLSALLSLDGCTVLDLDPLDEAGTAALVRQLLGLSPALAARVEQHCAGNPGFAVGLVADWVLRGLLRVGEKGFEAEGDLPIPADLTDLWVDRVAAEWARLPAPARTGLQLAACLGDAVSRREWQAAAAGLEASEAGLQAWVRAGLMSASEVGWRFTSPGVRVVLGGHAEVPEPVVHAACAEAVDALDDSWRCNERVGLHLLGAGRPEAAAARLLLAARDHHDHGSSARCRRMLELHAEALTAAGVPEDDERWGLGRATGLLMWAGEIIDYERGLAEGRDVLREARARGWTDTEREVLWHMGRLAWRGRRLEEARDLLNEALAAGAPPARVKRWLGNTYWYLGERELAEQCHREALASAEGVEEDGQLGAIVSDLADYAAERGDWDEAVAGYQRAIALAHDDLRGGMVARVNLGNAAVVRGDIEQAHEVFEQVRVEAEEDYALYELCCALGMLVYTHAVRGEWASWDAVASRAHALVDHVRLYDETLAERFEGAAAIAAEAGHGDRAALALQMAADQRSALA